MPAVQHRSDRERDRRDVHRRRRHQAGRRGLVAADGQHHAVERIAVKQLDEPEIGEVAVEARGRPLAGLLDRMHRKFDRDAARLANAFADPLGQHDVMAVAGREVRAGLGDADDRLAGLQFLARQPEIQIALEIERRHRRIVRIVEPVPRPQAARGGRGTVVALLSHTFIALSLAPNSFDSFRCRCLFVREIFENWEGVWPGCGSVSWGPERSRRTSMLPAIACERRLRAGRCRRPRRAGRRRRELCLPGGDAGEGKPRRRCRLHAAAGAPWHRARRAGGRQACAARKAASATVGELEDLRQCAGRAGVTLFTAWHSQFAPAVPAARRWIAAHRPRRIQVDVARGCSALASGPAMDLAAGRTRRIRSRNQCLVDPDGDPVGTGLSYRGRVSRCPENRAAPIAAELSLSTAGQAHDRGRFRLAPYRHPDLGYRG